MEKQLMRAGKNRIKSRTITVDDYYLERFYTLEVEMKQLREDFSKRFDEFNRRFEESRADSNRRFEEIRIDFNRRFDESRNDTNRRFDEADRRFDSLTRRIDRFMVWSFGMTVSSTGLIIAAMRFWK